MTTKTFDENQDIVAVRVQTDATDSSGFMRFNVYVDGEQFGPYDVPNSDKTHEYELETIGDTFELEALQTSEPDLTVSTFDIVTRNQTAPE